jgi:hypothetical protein
MRVINREVVEELSISREQIDATAEHEGKVLERRELRLELLRRLASLVPAPRANLTRFHGVFAPGAKLRPFRVPQAGAEEVRAGLEAAARKERMKEKTPRVDFRSVAQEDVRLRRVRLSEVWRQAQGDWRP